MLKNLFKIGFRNLLKHKQFSMINILGLSAGLTCCLLILLFVVDEYSYDKFHEKYDRIYRVQYQINNLDIASIPPVMSDQIQAYFNEIELTARAWQRALSVQVGQSSESRRFEEDNVFFVDSSLVNIFTFETIHGDLKEALTAPNTLVLSQSIAEKYFGDDNPLGKTVQLEGQHSYVVGAVVKDFPPTSHIHFNMLLAYDNMYDLEPEALQKVIRQNFQKNWMVSHSHTYVLLKPGANPAAINDRFADFVVEKIPDPMQRGQHFILQPMSSVHLNNVVAGTPESPGNEMLIFVLAAVGFITLLIACVNFINLTTARFIKRAKEIGIRKVMGAQKSHLILQFLGEAFIITLASGIASLCFAYFLLPQLNDLMGKSIDMESLLKPQIIAGFGLLLILTSLIAGLYPAIFISRVSLLKSLKGNVTSSGVSLFSARKLLVIFQFMVALLLVSGTILVFDQLTFLQNQSLGFSKDLMVTVPIQSQNFNNLFGGVDETKRQQMNTFEDALKAIPGVKGSTASAGPPGFGVVNRNVIPQGYTMEDRIIAPVYAVDYDFIKTYDMELLAGRDFSQDYGTDHQQAFIVNEEAIKAYNLGGSADEALGKSINVEGKEGSIIGVVADFNYLPLSQAVGPLIMEIGVPSFNTYSIKLDGNNLNTTLEKIEQVWNANFPDQTFNYTFLDEALAQSYTNEAQMAKLIRVFAMLAIIISCLGSYGLIMFIVSQKVKEVGIRKVLGATVTQITALISVRFLVLVILGFSMAVPLCYWLVSLWLENFAYRMNISVLPFMKAFTVLFIMVLATISWQTIKAARANPVNALRDD